MVDTAREPRFVDLQLGKSFCALSEEGEVWCWGAVPQLGTTRLAMAARPVRIEGLKGLVGFSVGLGGIVGWRRDGSISALIDSGGFAVQSTLVVFNEFCGLGWDVTRLTQVRGDGGSGCVELRDGDLACAREATFYRLPSVIRKVDGRCGLDAQGRRFFIDDYFQSMPQQRALHAVPPNESCSRWPVPTANSFELSAAQGFHHIASNGDVACGLRDGHAYCAGALGSWLGDGTDESLTQAIALPSFVGATSVSTAPGSNITCFGYNDSEIRCVGRYGTQQVDPKPFSPPEKFDSMVGSFPLCVRGALTKHWYCRDPFGSFFRGAGKGQFDVVIDPRSAKPANNIKEIRVDEGRGITAQFADGSHLNFYFRGNAQPLRFTHEQASLVPALIAEQMPPPSTTPKLAMRGAHCGIDLTATPWCWGPRESLNDEFAPAARKTAEVVRPRL